MSTLVKNLEKMSRPIIFDGLKSRTCHPSDIDSMLEYYNKYLLLTEVKEEGKDITTGQKICLTRIVDAWDKASQDKVGVVILTHHPSSDKTILLADTTISKIYIGGKWFDMTKKNINYKQFLTLFAEKHNISHMKF